MSTIYGDPPPAVAADLAALGDLLQGVPKKRKGKNILVATWNIREFSNLTKAWVNPPNKSPARNWHALVCIAEIVRRFDVVAVQEVDGNLRALRNLIKELGEDWGFLMTDETRGPKGDNERLAFIFDRKRVKPSGLACELVIPAELEEGDSKTNWANVFQRQFARTPYAVSFLSSGKTFILVTLHIYYGKKSGDRTRELQAIANWMADWAKDSYRWHHNLIVLGDFNIDREGDPLYDAFTSTGLQPAEGLRGLPRTVFDNPADPDTQKYYDQIAWFVKGNKSKLRLNCINAGMIDFRDVVMSDLTNAQLSWRISDHFPLWVEFEVDE